ncbi:MAG: putative ABC transporter permease subunit, partial [Planctomycetia bacterium]
ASREARFLLVRPLPSDQIFAFKFQESLFFSGWGFMLVCTPLMLAYGLQVDAPLHFYAMAMVFFLAYAVLPGSVGALLCLLVVTFTPKRKREALAVLVAGCLAAGGYLGFQLWTSAKSAGLTRGWVNGLVRQLNVSNLPFLPSHWISKGLLASSHADEFQEGLFYLGVLLSNALFAYLITAYAYRLLYRTAYNRVQSHAYGRRVRADHWTPWVLERLFAPFSGPIRVLILKDVRSFARDPVQSLQVLIFTGLLVFYFVNIGRMNYYTQSPYWQNLVGFTNLAVTGLLLAAFTSRFIFPLLSLEGQKFWILGLAPISRDSVLWGKFAFSFGGAVVVTTLLTILGAVMLKQPLLIFVLQILTMLILCSGVSGIAVGLGARFPDVRESDPSKIAAGFGGTLNLVVSMVFIFTVVATMAVPCHFYSVTLATEQGRAGMDFEGLQNLKGISQWQFVLGLGFSILMSIGLGAFATWYPMRLGIRAFRRMEF